jgi:hypothetical protein
MAEKSDRNQEKSQSERFKQAARELGCDESEERFDRALKKVAKPVPKAAEPKKRERGR